MPKKSYDFGILQQLQTATSMHFKHQGKDIVEQRTAVTIKELYRHGSFRKPFLDYHLMGSGGITFYYKKDPIHHDRYLELRDPGPTNRCSVVNLGETACHFGGRRRWFICPSCEAHMGVLYKDRDDFKCRKCLNLCYLSQKLNYRGIVPRLRKMLKLSQKEWDPRWQSYRGKPTKRGLREDKRIQELSASSTIYRRRFDPDIPAKDPTYIKPL
jgi:hypothetical protein